LEIKQRMEFYKDRNKWSLILAALFLLAVLVTGSFIYNLHLVRRTSLLLYCGLGAISLFGGLGLWVTYHARRKLMIFRENERDEYALSPSLLTVSPKVADGDPPRFKQGNAHQANGHGGGLTTIYGEDKNIRYISPAAETILGYKQIELIGETDVNNIHPDHRSSFTHLFSHLKDNPEEKVKVQYAYKSKEGNYIWLETTGSNGLSDPEINGYLFQTTDITARRLEEEANRMRSKIQALSENSPDLIIRLEEGAITYINPIIEYYTGKGAAAFLNKKTRETGLDHSILESWAKIVAQVSESGGKMILEMDFPSTMGNRIMQVHAIPENDEKGVLESVLVVSHDITDRKKIELEVQHQNRKITESIRYAKRIQGAILPNARLIDRTLRDSFILYKPRDVVSGDFPWFAQVKDDIFMAAVDCTGHGVPGALLSLVGYFLLNDIVRSRRILEPGRILDLLDEGVSTTLRPDEDAGTKDGMDISLCRINLEEKEVVYAGAHRPLYVVRDGVLEEIKGNKFPIGGGIFKNQTNFTSTRIKMKHGDSIYFCSDGFCDQFGGPKGRKFGTRQLREIIEKVHTIPMKEAEAIFEDQWETWKGKQKQTDDVLLIGIKF
jgi:PAS domain S-box-containing protein